jgi:hypothetical protein
MEEAREALQGAKRGDVGCEVREPSVVERPPSLWEVIVYSYS